MRAPEPLDRDRLSRTWDAYVRDGASASDDEVARLIARLHERDDAPHVAPAFADRLLDGLVGQHPTKTPVTQPHSYRSSTMDHAVTGTAEPIRWPSRRSRGRIAGRSVSSRLSGWADLVAIAAVVILVFGAVLADRGGAPIERPSPHQALQLAAATPANEAASETTMYRGNAARTGELPGPGPEGVPTLAWSRQTERGPDAATVSADGRLFYTAFSEQTDTLDLAAADLATGEELWRVPIDVSFQSVPAVMDGVVYVGASSGLKVIGVNVETGDVVWTYQFAGPGAISSPVVGDGVVYVVGPDFTLYALDAVDAETLWGYILPGFTLETEGFSPGTTTLAVADGMVYGRGNDGVVFALDIRTGEPVWTATIEGSAEEQFLVSEGVVAVTAIDFSVTEGPRPVQLHALDAESGDPLREPVELTSPSTLAAADGVLFVADSLEDTGTVSAYDTRSGESLWNHEMGGSLRSPAYVDGQLYVLSAGDGTVQRLDAETGNPNWSVYLGAQGDPLIADGLLIASGFETIYAVTGEATDSATPTADSPVDLSGLTACEPPRTPPGRPVSGEPALTLDVESRPVDDSGASGPPTTIDGRPIEVIKWPFILADNVPSGGPASQDQVAAVEETIGAMTACAQRPGSESQLAGFFSDDFFRRGIVTPGADMPLGLSVQPDEEQLEDLEIFILEDGRLAAATVNEAGAGTLLVFVEEGSALLVDEGYQVAPQYPVSA